MTQPLRVALLDDYQGVALDYADWRGGLPDAELTTFRDTITDHDALVRRLERFEVIGLMRERTPFPRSLLAALPRLALLVTTGMRNAAVDVAAARERGVLVCGTASLGNGTAELTWGLILALMRHIPEESARVRAGGWQSTIGRDLRGKTLGILGLGRMGQQVARVGAAFGMNVLAWSQNLTEERAASGGARLASKEDLLRVSDVVTVHLVLSPRTRGILGRDELSWMKPTAILINTARSAIVDQAALIEALRDGRIGGAGLDVFEEEPLPGDSPFLGLPNVVLTPHLGYVTEDTYRVFYGEMLEDIVAWRKGTPVRIIEP